MKIQAIWALRETVGDTWCEGSSNMLQFILDIGNPLAMSARNTPVENRKQHVGAKPYMPKKYTQTRSYQARMNKNTGSTLRSGFDFQFQDLDFRL